MEVKFSLYNQVLIIKKNFFIEISPQLFAIIIKLAYDISKYIVMCMFSSANGLVTHFSYIGCY